MADEGKPPCRYGSKCYRKNTDHLSRYSHPLSVDGDQPGNEGRSDTGGSAQEHAPPSVRLKRGREIDDDNSISRQNVDSKKPKLLQTSFTNKDSPSSSSNTAHTVPSSQPSEENSRPANTSPCPSSSSNPDDSSPSGNATKGSYREAEGREAEVDSKELEMDRASADDKRAKIKRKFLVDMPDDFYQFWEFCQSLNHSYPESALVSMGLDLELVEPYNVLSGRLDGVSWEQCVLHSRYYYDPPEMVTILGQTSDLFHIGYFRDDPEKLDEALLVSNDASKGCEIKIEAQNIFAAVKFATEKALKSKAVSDSDKINLKKLNSQLCQKMEELNLESIDGKTLSKRRNKLVQAKCLHKIGIVVPYDKQTEVGYRPLPQSDKEIVKLLDSISRCKDNPKKRDQLFEPVQEMITYIQFANDECDYGMGLELGLDLFCHGDTSFHSVISHLLPLAYDLLGRPQYGKIIEKHLVGRELDRPLNVCVSIKSS